MTYGEALQAVARASRGQLDEDLFFVQLALAGNVRSLAATRLDISRASFYRRLRELMPRLKAFVQAHSEQTDDAIIDAFWAHLLPLDADVRVGLASVVRGCRELARTTVD